MHPIMHQQLNQQRKTISGSKCLHTPGCPSATRKLFSARPKTISGHLFQVPDGADVLGGRLHRIVASGKSTVHFALFGPGCVVSRWREAGRLSLDRLWKWEHNQHATAIV
eukprot:6184048-Pleurochrysis_carterae.AAC.1